LDGGIYAGFDVPIHYDPLLAKLVVWGEDRPRAVARARRALSELTLHGPVHNGPFHLWVLEQPAFLDGSYTTDFIGEAFDPASYLPPLTAGDEQAILAAAALFEAQRRREAGARPIPGRDDGRAAPSPWRLAARRQMTGQR
jgi:acetyl-CoA carboxylase biotin carboxylase subunit